MPELRLNFPRVAADRQPRQAARMPEDVEKADAVFYY
jgi:hypothetical protein